MPCIPYKAPPVPPPPCLPPEPHSPDQVCGEACVELEGTLVLQGLHGTVDGALVGHAAVRVGGHLLQACLHKVKW